MAGKHFCFWKRQIRNNVTSCFWFLHDFKAIRCSCCAQWRSPHVEYLQRRVETVLPATSPDAHIHLPNLYSFVSSAKPHERNAHLFFEQPWQWLHEIELVPSVRARNRLLSPITQLSKPSHLSGPNLSNRLSNHTEYWLSNHFPYFYLIIISPTFSDIFLDFFPTFLYGVSHTFRNFFRLFSDFFLWCFPYF